MLWLRVQGELRVAEFPSVELGLGAVVERLSVFPWHNVLSNTILEKKTPSMVLVNKPLLTENT